MCGYGVGFGLLGTAPFAFELLCGFGKFLFQFTGLSLGVSTPHLGPYAAGLGPGGLFFDQVGVHASAKRVGDTTPDVVALAYRGLFTPYVGYHLLVGYPARGDRGRQDEKHLLATLFEVLTGEQHPDNGDVFQKRYTADDASLFGLADSADDKALALTDAVLRYVNSAFRNDRNLFYTFGCRLGADDCMGLYADITVCEYMWRNRQ